MIIHKLLCFEKVLPISFNDHQLFAKIYFLWPFDIWYFIILYIALTQKSEVKEGRTVSRIRFRGLIKYCLFIIFQVKSKTWKLLESPRSLITSVMLDMFLVIMTVGCWLVGTYLVTLVLLTIRLRARDSRDMGCKCAHLCLSYGCWLGAGRCAGEIAWL